MIHLRGIEGETFAVMGLGGSGLATAEALAASGARVCAWDDDEGRRTAAQAKGIDLHDLGTGSWEGTQALVLSPGIPHTFPSPHPVAATAREAGVPIICDIELLARAGSKARFIGITGTNGKSTVTALIGHIFETAKRPAAVGGNLGPAALNLDDPGPDGVFVLELSSYQIERLFTATFDIAVLINISPDHLDRHGGIDGYIAAKERLFDLTRPGAVAVIGTDDEHCRALEARLAARGGHALVPISGEGPVPGGVWVEGGHVMDGRAGTTRLIADLSRAPQLPGSHNAQNAAAAAAVALSAGVSPAHIAEALASYPGLPHRQETVRRIGAVTFINDSKATNPDAALRAIACYPAIYWIAGGRAKDGGFAELTRARGTELTHVRHAFLIGEAADDIAAALNGAVPHTVSGTLDAAVTEAYRMAQGERGGEGPGNGGPVVLLSPACASFDQFTDFAARGEAFRRAVDGLKESAA